MMNQLVFEKTELTKILFQVSEFATLENSRLSICKTLPQTDANKVGKSLKLTEEAGEFLFELGSGKVPYFPTFTTELERAEKGSTLTMGELIHVRQLLTSARSIYTAIDHLKNENTPMFSALIENLYFDENLERDIEEKIISETEMSDHASERLFEIRKEIRSLNERVKNKLSEYLTGKDSKYLQDTIVTMRDNRYVLPVRAEYKNTLKGFIHDKSATGQTFFIEPEDVLEMNNELRSLAVDEKEEMERILKALSSRVGAMRERLVKSIAILEEIDVAFAKAEYGYTVRGVLPKINEDGVIEIKQGRHPLIDKKKVVPVSVSIGNPYRILIVSGPNTGGKTVTLKMLGLFTLMAGCGLFVPAKEANLSTYENVFCDIGDAQSIEADLSTFSSHLTNIISITENVDEKSLVLLDELGGGTDPEEGQALAKAVVEYLLKKKCVCVLTTHYTSLKEYAFETDGIENACMEFNADTLEPLYSIRIGLPGQSNALQISKRLGLKTEILESAKSNLSLGTQKFEKILETAEESRIEASNLEREYSKKLKALEEKIAEVEAEKDGLKKEKEKLLVSAKAEAKRIVSSRTQESERILSELEAIFEKDTLSESDLIKARTLKNKMNGENYTFESENENANLLQADVNKLKVGDEVFVRSINQTGIIEKLNKEKGKAQVRCGAMCVQAQIKELSVMIFPKKKQTDKRKENSVVVKRDLNTKKTATLELNVIGKTVYEAVLEVETFIDNAVVASLHEVRIIHGMGTGKLRKGLHEYLKTNRHVKSFRLGVYGEGESGVTVLEIQ